VGSVASQAAATILAISDGSLASSLPVSPLPTVRPGPLEPSPEPLPDFPDPLLPLLDLLPLLPLLPLPLLDPLPLRELPLFEDLASLLNWRRSLSWRTRRPLRLLTLLVVTLLPSQIVVVAATSNSAAAARTPRPRELSRRMGILLDFVRGVGAAVQIMMSRN